MRRGASEAQIVHLNFGLDSDFLTCCSDRIKIHIYKLNGTNTTSYFNLPGINILVPFTNSEWSIANFLLKDEEVKSGGAKALVANGHLHIFTSRGTYYKAVLTEKSSGELKPISN